MVQYVFTPWRDRQELLKVRQQFYGPFLAPPSTVVAGRDGGPRPGAHLEKGESPAKEAPSQAGNSDEQRRRDQHQAVDRVYMWVQRGNCPHMVESTALLMAAVLMDESEAATETADISVYAVLRGAYSTAFGRFVTGLLDGHQDKQRKQSMYTIAKTLGLPATFVELRHQSTHEQLPSLAKLRTAARKALQWIWEYYWRQLADEAQPSKEQQTDPCKELVLRYLRESDEATRRKHKKRFRQWDLDRVLKTIAELQESLPGNQVFLKCLKLSKELTELEAASVATEETATPTALDDLLGRSHKAGEDRREVANPVRVAPSSPEDVSELSTGWSRCDRAWKPKPIGMV